MNPVGRIEPLLPGPELDFRNAPAEDGIGSGHYWASGRVLRELSVAVRKSEALTLGDGVMPVADGLSSRFAGGLSPRLPCRGQVVEQKRRTPGFEPRVPKTFRGFRTAERVALGWPLPEFVQVGSSGGPLPLASRELLGISLRSSLWDFQCDIAFHTGQSVQITLRPDYADGRAMAGLVSLCSRVGKDILREGTRAGLARGGACRAADSRPDSHRKRSPGVGLLQIAGRLLPPEPPHRLSRAKAGR
jgi:hypothetical protein